MTELDVCNSLSVWNAKYGTDLVGREITIRHETPCHECGVCREPGTSTTAKTARRYDTAPTRNMYFTSTNPLGAKKWCGHCMAELMGGGLIPCSESDEEVYEREEFGWMGL